MNAKKDEENNDYLVPDESTFKDDDLTKTLNGKKVWSLQF